LAWFLIYIHYAFIFQEDVDSRKGECPQKPWGMGRGYCYNSLGFQRDPFMSLND
jgi:hypothetical protein